jgi:hypothetical protein
MWTLFTHYSGLRYLLSLLCLWLAVSACPAAAQDTLRNDDNIPIRAFKYPDVYGDALRNMRFHAFHAGTLAGVMLGIPTRHDSLYTTGHPDLEILVWASGEDSLPIQQQILLDDTTMYEDFASSIFPLDSVWQGTPANFVMIDLSDRHLAIDTANAFHIGYTALRHSSEDSIAILADDNVSSRLSSEFYNGHFVRIIDGWGVGCNFLIRAIIQTPQGLTQVIGPDLPSDFRLNSAYPNPFNPATSIRIELAHSGNLQLRVFDVLGRTTFEQNYDQLSAGTHVLALNGAAWSSGIYFARVEFGKAQHTVQLILEK